MHLLSLVDVRSAAPAAAKTDHLPAGYCCMTNHCGAARIQHCVDTTAGSQHNFTPHLVEKQLTCCCWLCLITMHTNARVYTGLVRLLGTAVLRPG
jgi:hypothetical protein